MTELMAAPPNTLLGVALEDLIACPQCDALHVEPEVQEDQRARCRRCGTTLMAPRVNALARITGLAATSVVLMVAAVFFPFLDLAVKGLQNRTSVLDAVLSFSHGLMAPLAVAVAALIVVIPTLRLIAILYALWPLVHHRPPWRHARHAFRMSEALKPWSMAEIFVLGVTVALVKVAGLATVTPGPAFWAFAALVIVTVLQDSFMCSHTIWKALDKAPRS